MANVASIKVCEPVSAPLFLVEEVQQLSAQLEQLRQENERLRCVNDRLRRDNARLQRELEQAKADLEAARRTGKRQAAPFSKGSPKPQPKKPGRKGGAAHGRHGHRPAPPPDRIDQTLDAPLPVSCPDCGGSIRETGVAAQFQTEIPRRPIIRQFNVHLGCCCGCGKRLQGRHPLQTADALGACASGIGPDAQAAIVVLNKTFGLSHAKIAQVFEGLFGMKLTRGASVQITLRAAERLKPADQEIRQEIKASARLTPDETGWRVAGQPAWLHAWVTERAVGYAIASCRKAEALQGVIGRDWGGKMTHDGFSSYDRFRRAIHQQCLGHILRRVRELAAKAIRGAVHYPRKLVALFTAAIHLRNRHLQGEVTAEQLKAARKEFDQRLRELAYPPRQVPEYETLSEHLWKHREEWFVFLEHPEVEPTNWEGEQAIRPAVVNRKVWGGNRTWPGARAQEILMSVLQTCKRLGRSGLDFVSQTLRAFGNPLLPHPILLSQR